MDDGGTAKAPVTRLRRRLSIEAEDVKSPSGVTTPTKKRGGKLAAKPQLDLIDENATEMPSKRTTRKTAVKTVSESAEEIILTPSRRSARIKSNTSITSETTTYDSPRAKRAARRTSQAGSDNETASTPARQVKRTRKDSTSSIDKQVETTTIIKTPNISKAIIEEETNIDDTGKTSVTRRSPRFIEQKEKDSILDKSAINISNSEGKKNSQSNELNENPMTAKQTESSSIEIPIISGNDINSLIKDKEQAAVNNSCVDLLIALNEKPQKIGSLKNKSCTDLDSSNIHHNKRNRTKSWTSISGDHLKHDNFYSDNEISKKKRKNNTITLNNTGSGNIGIFNKEENNKSIDKIKNNTSREKSFTNDFNISRNKDESSNNVEDSNPTSELFKNAPSVHVRSLIFTDEDSDSDIRSKQKQLKVQDQCVPIVHEIHDRDNLKSNISYEPMDIDETLTENVSIKNMHENNTAVASEFDKPISTCKSSISVEENAEAIKNNSNSVTKYSGTYLESQNLEKSNNENKSTLILSQNKDTSTNEIYASIQTSNVNDNEKLSKSVNVSDIVINRESNKANLPSNYLTSTPVQQKLFTKLGIQLDTSLISPKNVSNEKIDIKIALKNDHISETDSNELIVNIKENPQMSLITKNKNDTRHTTSEEESDTDTSRKQNSMIDDEVEQASDNYESGDSRNEEDREYERNNEILEKGETLDSEEDFSDDSEYEKDSFVVTSAEEDYELLSGSGDNLSMSDNELNMSSKSKKKYNERKLKEQKKASREMYNARHKLNESESSDVKPKTKKKKRQRLDSSAFKSDDEKVKTHEDCLDMSIEEKKKVKKSLSESVPDEESENEEEITIFNESKIDKVDPLLVQIKEEKQSPQKSLNISTVLVNDAVEEVNVNENVLTTKLSGSLDPLGSAINIDEEFSSDNENEEIVENYNSILKDLNKNTKKIKSFDISLNENKKKKKVKEPIIDELNITTTKTKKKNQNVLGNANNTEIPQSECSKRTDDSINQNDDDKASDSIDMRLLFSEDSNGSEHNCDNLQLKTKMASPVLDNIQQNETFCGASMGNDPEDYLIFTIDTKGTRDDNASDDISSEKKSKIKLKPSNLISKEDETENMSVEIKNTSVKKKKNKSLSHSNTSISGDQAQDHAENNIMSSEGKTKKAKLSFSTSVDDPSNEIDLKDFDDAPNDTEDITHSKKKKKKHAEKHTGDGANIEIQAMELATSGEGLSELTSSSKKKKKGKQSFNISSAEVNDTDVLELDEGPEEVMYHSNKKKKHSQDNIKSTLEVETSHLEDTAPEESSGKKKKKSKISSQDSYNKSSANEQDQLDIEDASNDVLYRKNKKKQSADKLQSTVEAEITYSVYATPDESPTNISSEKKKKKNTKKLQDSFNKSSIDTDNRDELYIDGAPDQVSYRKNKNKQSPEDNLQSNIEVETVFSEETASAESPVKISISKKKKKSKISQDNFNKSATPTGNRHDLNTEEKPSTEITYEIQKKKVVKQSSDDLEAGTKHLEVTAAEDVNIKALSSKKRKREHNREFLTLGSNQISEKASNFSLGNERKKRKTFQNNEIPGNIDNKHRKRKERDDEDVSKVSKVSKQSSPDKVYVQRLPSDILNKLEDKPRKYTTERKKPRVISTTEFMVEDQQKVKRNKPSNYLEESVYINNTPILKREKKIIKKPKVLPFIPTASTSEEGFTTNFRINILPGDNQFIAQATNVTDFRTDMLRENKLKKFRTFEKYKSQRKYKISKF